MNIRLFLASILLLTISCSKQKVIFSNNPNAPDYLHNRPVGASANEILSSAKYSSIVVEVQYMTGYAPDATAMNYLQGFLNSYSDNRGGITIVNKQIDPDCSTSSLFDQ